MERKVSRVVVFNRSYLEIGIFKQSHFFTVHGSRLINIHFPDLKLPAKTKGFALLDMSRVTVD